MNMVDPGHYRCNVILYYIILYPDVIRYRRHTTGKQEGSITRWQCVKCKLPIGQRYYSPIFLHSFFLYSSLFSPPSPRCNASASSILLGGVEYLHKWDPTGHNHLPSIQENRTLATVHKHKRMAMEDPDKPPRKV